MKRASAAAITLSLLSSREIRLLASQPPPPPPPRGRRGRKREEVNNTHTKKFFPHKILRSLFPPSARPAIFPLFFYPSLSPLGQKKGTQLWPQGSLQDRSKKPSQKDITILPSLSRIFAQLILAANRKRKVPNRSDAARDIFWTGCNEPSSHPKVVERD